MYPPPIYSYVALPSGSSGVPQPAPPSAVESPGLTLLSLV